METRRQKKVASLIHRTITEIFQHKGIGFLGRALVTVTNVYVTPDLLIARIYVSVYNHPKPQEVVDLLNANVKEIRKDLGNALRFQLRRIPQLEFYLDDTLDRIFKIEELLKGSGSKQDD